jgi:hypothetical protein
MSAVFSGMLSGRLYPPRGYVPLGRPDTCHSGTGEIPKTIDELGELVVHAYDLTVTAALELSIPVAGSVSGGVDRRVVLWEWMRYKALPGDDGVECRYGYVIRFCVTVNKWEAEGKVSLPFLTAKVEVGEIQASWIMQIRGLVGPKLDGAVLPPQPLSVETFVIAKQSLKDVIAGVHDPTTKFVPGVLIARVNPPQPETVYRQALVRSFGLYSIFRDNNRETAERRLESKEPAEIELLREVYAEFGLTDPKADPSDPSQERARSMLRGIRVEKDRFLRQSRRVAKGDRT